MSINKGMMSSTTDAWETPQDFFDKVNEQYKFEIDLCATPQNAKVPVFYTEKDNALAQEWTGMCWLNPPYGDGIDKWIKKAYQSTRTSKCTVVALLPARTDTKWFHDYIYMMYGVEVEFLKGRLRFGGSKSNAPFPSMLVIFKTHLNQE